ncbi:MAG: metallophosphoesterase, partial [Oscillospiraceae bacterium]|nr:metallophosphoesterase [Oscillospiraceae bacterium]
MQPLQFYLITDLHYFENALGASGPAYEARSLTDQKCIAETGASIDSALAQLAADTRTNIVLIAGDMTFNGEAASHRGVIKKLEALRAGGKTIYMVTGNHDGDNEPYAFSGAARVPVEGTRRAD